MSAFKRSEWNALLEDINAARANPPEDTDCEALPPLELVGPKHRWSKGDISVAQNAISEMCPDTSFDEIPDRWMQETVDALRDSIGWCGCEPDDCDPHEGDGAMFAILSQSPRVSSNCFGDDPDASSPLCGLIHGMNVGPPGIVGRSWGVMRVPSFGEATGVAGGVIDCQGNVVCESDETIPDHHGVYVECGDCGSENCQEGIADAEAVVATMPSLSYVLTVHGFFATCEECE